jgi:hypothetical protein
VIFATFAASQKCIGAKKPIKALLSASEDEETGRVEMMAKHLKANQIPNYKPKFHLMLSDPF